MIGDEKLGTLLLASLVGFMSINSTPAKAALPVEVPRLKVNGKQILDPSNTPIILRGWNWGQWDTAELPEDATNNIRQGANVVRIPLRWWGTWGDNDIDARDEHSPKTGYIKQAFLDKLTKTVDAATAAGLWVDLFVDSNCGQASVQYDTIALCGKAEEDKKQPANFMNSPTKKSEFIAMWKFLAQHFANTPHIGMYEILPEPNFTCRDGGACTDWDASRRFYKEVVTELRKVDKRTPFMVGANGGYDLGNIATAYIDFDKNLIYTANLLQGGSNRAFADPSYIAPLMRFRKDYSAPVFVQQVGTRQDNPDNDPTAVAKSVLQQLNDNRIGWTWWTYREQHSNTGYAPWSLNHDPSNPRKWLKNQEWLTIIADFFAAD